MKLTQKQKLFAEYYVQSNNATESAIKAGYSEKTAYAIGNENLKKLEIRKYIEDYRDEQAKENKWTLERLINEFATNHEIAREKEDIRGSNDSMKEIGKLLGHYEEKIRHSGEVNTNNPLKDLTTAELKKLINK